MKGDLDYGTIYRPRLTSVQRDKETSQPKEALKPVLKHPTPVLKRRNSFTQSVSKSTEPAYDFRVFSCGTKGGAYAADVTSFFIAEVNEKNNFISMDAGTSMDCIRAAKENGQLDKILNRKYNDQAEFNEVGYFRKKQLNGFLVTHAHTDHLAGLVISSADDEFKGKKPIIATKKVMGGVKKALNRPLWPNLLLKDIEFYDAVSLEPKVLTPMSTLKRFTKNHMHIAAYELSHDQSLGPSPSTVFKICGKEKKSCLLFFGDTAPDDAEWRNLKKGLIKELHESKHNPFKGDAETAKEQMAKVDALIGENADDFQKFAERMMSPLHKYDMYIINAVNHLQKLFKKRTKSKYGEKFHPLQDVWDAVANEVKDGTIHTIFIECSYDDNGRDEFLWYGHFIPKKLIEELEKLAAKVNDRDNKVTLSVVVMHIKPTFKKNNDDLTSYNNIKQALKWNKLFAKQGGKLKIEFFFPLQTDMIYLKKGKVAKIVPAPENAGTSAPAPPGGNARMEIDNLLQSDFGDGNDADVDYGNVNGQFMHHRQPQYGPKWHDSYHHEASQPYVGGDGGGYYVAPAHAPIHYQSPLNIDLLLVTTLLMVLCVCICCASFICGLSIRPVMRKLIKKTKRYQVHDDEVEHKYVV